MRDTRKTGWRCSPAASVPGTRRGTRWSDGTVLPEMALPVSEIIEAVRAGLAPHYMVEREIGAGGMARVFLAAEREPPRKVAIKVMNPGFSSPAFRARFTREIELTSGLQHPHIVPILAAQECLFVPDSPDDLCYYVMPYVEGESLRHRLLRED